MASNKSANDSAKKAENAALKAKAAAAETKAAALKERLNTGHAAGFMNFIREQGVVGLAVGLAIGTAAGDTVKKLVEGFITPIVQLLVGSQEGLESASWQLKIGDRVADFGWGAFVSSFITLAATALVIYFIVHLMKLDRADKAK